MATLEEVQAALADAMKKSLNEKNTKQKDKSPRGA